MLHPYLQNILYLVSFNRVIDFETHEIILKNQENIEYPWRRFFAPSDSGLRMTSFIKLRLKT